MTRKSNRRSAPQQSQKLTAPTPAPEPVPGPETPAPQPVKEPSQPETGITSVSRPDAAISAPEATTVDPGASAIDAELAALDAPVMQAALPNPMGGTLPDSVPGSPANSAPVAGTNATLDTPTPAPEPVRVVDKIDTPTPAPEPVRVVDKIDTPRLSAEPTLHELNQRAWQIDDEHAGKRLEAQEKINAVAKPLLAGVQRGRLNPRRAQKPLRGVKV